MLACILTLAPAGVNELYLCRCALVGCDEVRRSQPILRRLPMFSRARTRDLTPTYYTVTVSRTCRPTDKEG